MNRAETKSVSEMEALVHLCRSVPLGQHVVQLSASRSWPAAWHDINPSELRDEKVGLLHLGPGRHRAIPDWEPLFLRGTVLLVEGWLDGATQDYLVELAARGTITSLHGARYWPDLAVCTYIGIRR